MSNFFIILIGFAAAGVFTAFFFYAVASVFDVALSTLLPRKKKGGEL